MLRRMICAILALLICLAGLAQAEALLDEYDMVSKLGEDRYLVRKDGLWGMADGSGAEVLAPQFREEPKFEDGCAVVSTLNGAPTRDFSGIEEPMSLCGVIDAEGNIRIPLEYESVKLTEGAALARDGEGYRFLNLDGTPVNDKIYYRAEPFVNGYAAVGVKVEVAANTSDPYGAAWGVIDRQGSEVIPCEYDALTLSASGPALVGVRTGEGAECKYGYIDMDGNTVIELQYDSAEPFVDGIAAVCTRVESGKADDSEPNLALWGAIDAEGNELLPMEYGYVTVHEGGRIEAQQSSATRWFAVEGGELAETEAPQ